MKAIHRVVPALFVAAMGAGIALAQQPRSAVEEIEHKAVAFDVYNKVQGRPSIIALKQFCAERLPRYMLPESFDFRSELPKSSTGKIAKRQLLEEAMSS